MEKKESNEFYYYNNLLEHLFEIEFVPGIHTLEHTNANESKTKLYFLYLF